MVVVIHSPDGANCPDHAGYVSQTQWSPQGVTDEASVPAQCPQAVQEARVPRPDEHPRWPSGDPRSAPKGSHPPGRVIAGLSGRRALARLRAEGIKAGRGPVRLQYRATNEPISRIAFAISRKVGGAVARNRIRRRIQAILRDLDRETENLPPPGDLLIRVTAPLDGWSHTRLRTTMIDLLLSLVSA